MTDLDYFEMCRQLSLRLRELGYAPHAEKLDAALRNGATGTEIVMALRFHLDIIIQEVRLPQDDNCRASEILRALNDALARND